MSTAFHPCINQVRHRTAAAVSQTSTCLLFSARSNCAPVFRRTAVTSSVFKFKLERGVTLLELMLVLVILGVLLGLAVPSMRYQYWDWKARAQVYEFFGLVMRARGYAQSTGVAATLCPWSEPLSSCVAAETGVFAAVNGKGELLYLSTLSNKLRVLNRSGSVPAVATVTWGQDGIADRNATYSVCTPVAEVNWALVLNRVGRPRVARGWGQC